MHYPDAEDVGQQAGGRVAQILDQSVEPIFHNIISTVFDSDHSEKGAYEWPKIGMAAC